MSPAKFATSFTDLPRRVIGAVAGPISAPLAVLAGYEVDDWGRDRRIIDLIGPVQRLRWNAIIGGTEHIPVQSGALLLCNNRKWSWAPLAAALSLSAELGRPVRFAGRPDVAPVGPALRRLGGILARPDEVRGALAHGELVLVSATHTAEQRDAGAFDHRLIQPAVLERVAILPTAILIDRWRRGTRVHVGPAVRRRRLRRGPLAEVELAELAARRVQQMLDGFGGF